MTNPSGVALPVGVQELFDRIYRAWADGDGAAFAADYLPDAVVAMPGVLHLDRAAVQSSMSAGFAGPLRGSRGIDEPISVRVHGDTAIVVSSAGILMPGETDLPAERRKVATWVLTATDDGWRVAAYINTPA